jgi:hypothetical protein
VSKLISLFFLLGFCLPPSGISEVNAAIEAKVSKDRVTTGEVFTYTVKIEGEFFSPKLMLPEFKNFIIVSQNQAQNYSLKGNRTIMEFVLIYGLIAPKPGVFTIERLVLEDRGRRLETKAVRIEVTGRPLEDKRKIQPYLEKGTDI